MFAPISRKRANLADHNKWDAQVEETHRSKLSESVWRKNELTSMETTRVADELRFDPDNHRAC